MATITSARYPKFREAFAQAELREFSDESGIEVPFSIVDLAGCEAALAALNEEDFLTFCYGELNDQKEIEGRDFFLALAGKILNDYCCQ